MIIFEGKAFNEKMVWYIDTFETDERIEKQYQRVTKLRIHMNIKSHLNSSEIIEFTIKDPKMVISKVNELTELINKREEELLKLTHSIRIY